MSAGVKVIWSAKSVQQLTTLLGQHQNSTQADFITAGTKSLKTLDGKAFTSEQLIAKARQVSKQAKDHGYSLSVPRKASHAAIVEDWGSLFKAAGLKKPRKKS